ncbi:MAG: cobalamin biosynthesis central domain-containing protein [Clostridia bacterium]
MDPAVVVMDDAGRYVVSLLSGHLGGANELTRYLSAHLGAQAIITTSTDVHGVFAVDVWSQKAGCVIGEVPRIKWISSALLEGTSVGFVSDYPVSGLPECLRESDGELESAYHWTNGNPHFRAPYISYPIFSASGSDVENSWTVPFLKIQCWRSFGGIGSAFVG